MIIFKNQIGYIIISKKICILDIKMSANVIRIINERIKEEGGFEEVIELDLTDLSLTSITNDIRKVLDRTKNVQIVLLSDNLFDNLDNLPDWQLTAMDISNNKLTDNALLKLTKFRHLAQLIASNNQIKTIEGLDPLFDLKQLQEIDLSGNPVCKVEGYRSQLFSRINSLHTLDGHDINGNEVSQDEDLQDEDEQNRKEGGRDEQEGKNDDVDSYSDDQQLDNDQEDGEDYSDDEGGSAQDNNDN